MRVILDECLPRKLAKELSGHAVSTVQRAGWAGVTNGELLDLIEGSYDAFVTVDKNLPIQHTVSMLSFGIVVIRAYSNRLKDLKPLAPAIVAALAALRPGEVVYVPSNDPSSAMLQRDLVVGHVKLSEAAGDRAHLERALKTALAMQRRGQLAPRDAEMIPELRRRLGQP